MGRKLFLLVISLVFGAESSFSSASVSESVLSLSLPPEPTMRLEQVYLHEFTATIMETARHYALSAGRVPDLGIESLRKFRRCQVLLTSLQRRHANLFSIAESERIDRTAYFEHLLMLSLALAHMNRRLYELGKARTELQKDFMRSVTDKDEVQEKVKTLDDKIATLDRKMDSIFAADPANLLLTVEVGSQKRPLYQKIVADYYHLLSMEKVGPRLIEAIQETNQPLLDSAWEKVTTRNRKFLHQAWRHTCGKRKLRSLLRPHKLAALGFYIKHRALAARVESLLTEAEDSALLEVQAEAESYFKQRITPEHFHNSTGSFFGTLAALTLPAFLVRKHNKLTLMAMGVAGGAHAAYRYKALYDMRYQLETGALSGLNSYNLYHDFRSNTSLSRTAFSHLSVVALAMVLRGAAMPKRLAESGAKQSGLLTAVGVLTSLSSMLVAEAVQTGNINFLKDRDFLYNMLVIAMLEVVIYTAADLNLPYAKKAALLATASVLISVTGHVLSGKEVNWDRIIFDSTYISTYSLFKAKYFYSNGGSYLIKKLKERGIESTGAKSGVLSVLALINSIAGNVPYAFIARRWVERQPDYHKFPLPAGQRDAELGNIDLEQQLTHLLTHYNLEDAELREILRQLLVGMPAELSAASVAELDKQNFQAD